MHDRASAIPTDAGQGPCGARAGVGLRPAHYRELLERRPALALVEVHSENYFGEGGQPHHFLEQFRARYSLSLHGVGLSLGSADGLPGGHLDRLAALVERYEPALVSEHLCWSAIAGRHGNDLLPMPYTEAALDLMCERVERVQARLRRRILVENISSYLQFAASAIPEWEFLAELARRSGCGILLDVNNVYVSAHNHGFDARTYIDAIPSEAVGEIHLAGFDRAGALLIDTHGARVHDDVWALYEYTLERVAPCPTLIEWDTALPPLAILLDEAGKAAECMSRREPCHALVD
jgi:hypothetical protein